MKFFATTSLLLFALFFASCKKEQEEECDAPKPITLTADSVVYEGWPLHINADNYYTGQTFTYKWKGPGGWSHETVYPSYEYPIEIIDSMTAAKSGTYTVDIFSEKCVMKHGEITIQVVPVPNPPCSVANNSTTTSQTGIGGTTYNNINGSISGSSTYDLIATGNSQNITMRFNQGDVPIPGVYTSGIQSLSPNKVSIIIGTFQQYYQMEPGQPVYVNLVNGNTIISFCGAVFHDANGNGSITISGKITIP